MIENVSVDHGCFQMLMAHKLLNCSYSVPIQKPRFCVVNFRILYRLGIRRYSSIVTALLAAGIYIKRISVLSFQRQSPLMFKFPVCLSPFRNAFLCVIIVYLRKGIIIVIKLYWKVKEKILQKIIEIDSIINKHYKKKL